MPEPVLIYAPSQLQDRLRQAEILSDLVQPVVIVDSIAPDKPPVVENITHPFAVVMTQDCDLDWDFRARNDHAPEHKRIRNILFCEMETAETLRAQAGINSDLWRRITGNNDERYQVLTCVAPGNDARKEGTPALAIDFKRYFTVPADEAYRQIELGTQRRAVLQSPYREHLCSRFFYYQSRTALPQEHVVHD